MAGVTKTGQSLGDRLAAGRLSDAQAISVLRQLAGQLAAIHQSGRVHRAISADEVQVGKEGRVALSAHLELSSLDRWPQVLGEARTLLLERFGIEHVTLQPELAGTQRQPPTAVVKLFPRR